MSEYRKDVLSSHWVIIASDRDRRPSEFVTNPVRRHIARCPFCAGNEQETPDAVAVYPESAARQGFHEWQVRVVPNKYPALRNATTPSTTQHEITLRTDAPGVSETGIALPSSLAWIEPGCGNHEVIIESPQHTTSYSELTAEQAQLSMMAYRDRLQHVAGDRRFRYGLIFKNCRAGAGATLEHSHSQLVVTTHIPVSVDHELRASAEYYAQRGKCIFCAIQNEESTLGARIVAASERFIAWCPFASRVPYETWIMPRSHAHRFELAKLDDLAELARFFQLILRGLEMLFAHVPYNFWIHTAPFDIPCDDHYHWHIELFPRITNQAGFEWGAGCFVNPVAPEESALKLREAIEGDGHSVSNQ